MTSQTLIAGNWKMNGLLSSIDEVRAVAEGSCDNAVRIAIFPPYTLIHPISQILGHDSRVVLGGQDCHYEDYGAYTGDVSAHQLYDAGARMVILGHSERRHGHKEPCETVALKVCAALNAGLEPIICIGETLEQRKEGLTHAVLSKQLRDSLPDDLMGKAFHVAYEPVWAIGTGMIATDDQIVDAFSLIRRVISERFGTDFKPHLLYGGSVKPDNAVDVLKLDGVGGALVGGASLKAKDFLKIIRAAP
ncbi:triose-phosphate isomerase [Asticcacaulis machinosus]|uniref:Triosephosphate isomerase n=1 Tax=Asticcacaulis machinosus TaxID=2984211 RepID=A0ABT5HEX0_9CAUL|nr:triose-phosphate isomerase [Asticcacaulis machinosus]MDC7674806.1 triose-phosphate isomerase [Asticcacaulis machinosus]